MFWSRISLLIVLISSSDFLLAQSLKKIIEYGQTNGLQITGLDDKNPVIYDNDLVIDTPEVFYLWLKANKGQVRLVGNINTRDMYNQPDYEFKHDDTFSQWTDLYDRAVRSNLKNIPAPVKGADVALVKPKSGKIEDTKYKSNAGSDLIISEAHKASAEKPLCIFVGGNVSTIAHAFLKDHTIADKILVFHVHGYKHNEHTYNTFDFWGAYIVMKRLRYINWSGDMYSWYHKVRPLKVDLTGMPDNPFTEMIKYWYGAAYAEHGDMGDGPPVFYFFDHSLWKGVIRLQENSIEGTPNKFDYLLVSANEWAGYGRNLSEYLRNPDNYISPVSNVDKK